MQTFINNSVEQQKASKGEWLHKLPSELVGVLPQNIWVSLSLEQKKDLLRQHNLLDKYNNLPVNPEQEISNVQMSAELPPIETGPAVNAEAPVDTAVEAPKVSEIPEIVGADKGLVDEKEKFAKSVENVRAKEEENNAQANLSQEDKTRITQEQDPNAAKNNVKTSIGYKIEDNTITNAVTISHNGNTDDGRTWAAALVRKIFAIID